jgi:hypothetical protein
MGTRELRVTKLHPSEVRRPSPWAGLIVATALVTSLFFACSTPFAALATLAALNLARREAIAVMGIVWLVNQLIGFGMLGYPWTADCIAWGVVLGLSGYLAMLAAITLSSKRPVPLAVSLPFVGAFAAFELGLYAAGAVLPGGSGAFSAAILRQVFVVNLLGLIGLLAIHHMALLVCRLSRDHLPGMATTTR